MRQWLASVQLFSKKCFGDLALDVVHKNVKTGEKKKKSVEYCNVNINTIF